MTTTLEAAIRAVYLDACIKFRECQKHEFAALCLAMEAVYPQEIKDAKSWLTK